MRNASLGAGVGVEPLADTPLSAGCLACPVRIPCPLGTAMFSLMQQPRPICTRLPATLQPPGLGVLREGPDWGGGDPELNPFSLHNSALFFTGRGSDSKYLFFFSHCSRRELDETLGNFHLDATVHIDRDLGLIQR